MYKNSITKLKGFLYKCPEEKKHIFASSSVALLVSVGQAYHEKDKLCATINFINRNFRECNVMVNDSLQKYTISLIENISLEKSYEKSVHEGKKWVDRNRKYLKLLRIPYKLYHWDYWLNKEKYTEHRNKINKLYKQNAVFKEKMNLSIELFLKRNHVLIEKNGYQKVYDICLDYLLEETCIIMKLWKDYEYDFLLYPGKMLDILEYVHYILKNGELLYWLHLKFRCNNRKK